MGQDVEDGRLIGGRYRLGGVLGRGGMGTVWRGQDETLGRTVAVKELRFPSSVEEDEKQRLITRTLREAKAIARIRSGSAVTVFDVVNEDDRPWIVMELVEGRSLADQIRDDGPLLPQRAAEVGLAVLDVLRAAHREGILHRDVKPSNVLLEEGTGRVVLTDFGIAKVEGDPSVTSTGMLVGAPSYISPERARGKPPGPPADLWSLGGLLYAAVEGHPPYDKGSAISTLTAVMTEPLRPPERAGGLSEVIFGLLEKDPDKRLDVAGARALLREVVSAPDATPVAPDATRTVAIPPLPDGPADRAVPSQSGARGSAGTNGSAGTASAVGAGAAAGAAGGEARRSAERRLRAALRSVRNAAGAATSAARTTTGSSAAAPADSGPGTAPSAAGASTEADAANGSAETGTTAQAAGDGERGTRDTTGLPANTGLPAPRSPGEPDRPRPVPAALAALLARFSRRTLLIAAAVLATFVVLGAVLLATAQGGEEEGGNGDDRSAGATEGRKGGGNTDDKSGSKDGKEGKDDPGDKGGGAEDPADDPGPAEEDGGKDEAGKGGAAIPDGYAEVSDERFHFSMAMPGKFERTGIAGTNSGGKYSDPQGGYPKIQVDFNDSPLANAVLAWKNLEPAVRNGSSGYRVVSIEKSGWRDYPTVADWTFERQESGRKVRVLNRGFKVDSERGYAIMITCEAGKWDDKECRTLRETAFRTFQPE